MENNIQNIISTVPSTILLGYGGSRAYGTQLPTSDIDIRGIYMNPLGELIGTKKDSETKEIDGEDTVLYSVKKMFHLLSQCNPNTIEILGLRPQDYLYVTKEGQMILDNKSLFLSKRAVFTFGQYAKAQLNRLVNKAGRAKEEIVQNEARSLRKMRDANWSQSGVGIEESLDGNIFVQINNTFEINEFCRFAADIQTVHSDYKSSVRNNKAIEHGKLAKHMMHLMRLYMMGIDILEKGEIVTYRYKEHDFLMSIRNGEFLEKDGKTPTKDFEKYLTSYQNLFDRAAENSKLPERADEDKLNKLMMDVVRTYYKD